MKYRLIYSLYLSLFFLVTNFKSNALQAKNSSTPNLRIESPTTTLFEGPITSNPRNLTASPYNCEGGCTHICDGVEGNRDGTTPFNTALDALDQASRTAPGFTYTLGYDEDMSDFYIISLAGYNYSDGQWGKLWNWKLSDYGNAFGISGCRQQVQTGDDVLWAYVQNEETAVFLKVTPSTATVKKGGKVTFTITDGLTGKVQPSATIHDVKADGNGQVVVRYPTTGYFAFKAKEMGAVRSEIVKVTVTN